MNSWRTTLVGVLSGLAIISTALIAAIDNDPTTVFDINAVYTGLAVMGIGIGARDNGVSSEQAGAK